MKLSHALKTAGLELVDSPTPELDALILLEHAAKLDRASLLARLDQDVTTAIRPEVLMEWRGMIKRRTQNEPVAYITGHKEFYGLDFNVSCEVLIPRPESEAISESVIKQAPSHVTVLDVGTGSGAVAIAIAKHRPDLKVYASDNSARAIKVARQNAARHGVKVGFVISDLLEQLTIKPAWIAANLPYLPGGYPVSPETSFEPETALYAGSDGLDIYRRFFNQIPATAPGATVTLEHLPKQRREIIRLAQKSGLMTSVPLNAFCTLLQ